jgi:hypothetical protein
MESKPGLKNHEIAQLVSAITNELHRRWQLPEMLRQVVSGVVCDQLSIMNRMIDNPLRHNPSDATAAPLSPPQPTIQPRTIGAAGTAGVGTSPKYDKDQIAKELSATASGAGYYGNALFVAMDIPVLTDEEKWVLCRWLDGSQVATDSHRLQDIAIKIRCDG